MKITLSGSLGNIGRPLTQKLIELGHAVTVISSSADRKQEIKALGANAAIGSVSDAAFLKTTFLGADAVFAMTPPNLGGSNVITNTIQAGKAFASAIKDAGVIRVVMLSSIGADLSNGNGPIAGLHTIESLYNSLQNVAITYLRAGYFYTNYYNDIPLIKGLGVLGANYPATTKLPLVHPTDIAMAAAEELQRKTNSKDVRYIISDLCTADELTRNLGRAIGKPELPWVEFTDEQLKQGMMEAGLPEEMAGLYTEMGTGLRSGRIQADFESQGSPISGSIKLEHFLADFAKRL